MHFFLCGILLLSTAYAVEIQVANLDGGDIWIGIQGDDGKAHLSYGGYVLGSQQQVSFDAPSDWSGRFWARTWCNGLNNHCLTGDCGNKIYCSGASPANPVTLVEFQFSNDGNHNYGLSVKNGFNIIAKVETLGASCATVACQSRINNDCPDELKYNTNEGVQGCKSACVAYNNDETCCRGDHSGGNCQNNQWTDWFRNECPDTLILPTDGLRNSCGASGFKITFGG